jgi:hypothetical protein
MVTELHQVTGGVTVALTALSKFVETDGVGVAAKQLPPINAMAKAIIKYFMTILSLLFDYEKYFRKNSGEEKRN